MTSLILSDLHLGDPRLRKDGDLLRLLRNLSYDSLILNGDIIDLWAETDQYKILAMHPLVIESLRGICKTKKVTWIIGNHELLKSKNTLDVLKFLLPEAEIVDKLEFSVNNKKILAIHGYQMESGLFSKFLCDMKLLMWRVTGFDAQKFCATFMGIYPKSINKKQKKYVDSYKGSCDVMVIGHTHVPICDASSEIRYMNGGDWVQHNSYIILEDNRLVLCGTNDEKYIYL